MTGASLLEPNNSFIGLPTDEKGGERKRDVSLLSMKYDSERKDVDLNCNEGNWGYISCKLMA